MSLDNNSTFTASELYEVIIKECHDGAIRWSRKYRNMDTTELESYLVEKVWIAMSRVGEADYRFRFIRHVVKMRVLDFIKSDARYDQEINYCDLEPGQLSKEMQDVDTTTAVAQFRATLDDQSNQFLDLKLGGYSKGEICEIMDVSINTPRNIEKKIAKLAEAFGL